MNEERDLFESMTLESPMNTDTSVKDVIMDDAPDITSPDWNEYVMELFEENELIDGMPLSAGLRRVSELVLGPVKSSGPVQVFPPKDDHSHGRATVVWKVDFMNGQSFSDVADCWEGNTDDTFCAFSGATAGTRAEARALRKALRLRSVAAEEVTKKDTAQVGRSISRGKTVEEPTAGEYQDSSRMTDPQSNHINVKCKQLDINVGNLFKEEFNVSVSRKVTKKQASAAIEKLNSFQRDTSSIPKSIIGYNSDWRN